MIVPHPSFVAKLHFDLRSSVLCQPPNYGFTMLLYAGLSRNHLCTVCPFGSCLKWWIPASVLLEHRPWSRVTVTSAYVVVLVFIATAREMFSGDTCRAEVCPPRSFQKFFHTRFLLPKVFFFSVFFFSQPVTGSHLSHVLVVSFSVALWCSLVLGRLRRRQTQKCKPLQSVTLVNVALNAVLCSGLEVGLHRGHHEFFCWSYAAPPVAKREALSQRLSCSQSGALCTMFRSRSLEQPLIPSCAPLVCVATDPFILGAHYLSVVSELQLMVHFTLSELFLAWSRDDDFECALTKKRIKWVNIVCRIRDLNLFWNYCITVFRLMVMTNFLEMIE